MKWISIKKEIPNQHKPIIVLNKDNYITKAVLSTDGKFVDLIVTECKNYFCHVEDVLFWFYIEYPEN